MRHQLDLRFPCMAVAGLSLLLALGVGLVRLGWDLPSLSSSISLGHGPLMLIGFLGTLVSLERAVALNRFWPYGAPLFAGLAAVGIVLGFPFPASPVLAVLGSLFLTAIFFSLYTISPSAPMVTMGIASLAWVGGNVLWLLGHAAYKISPWWIGFLVLMIAGGRLELSRLMRLSDWDRMKFFLGGAIFLVGLLVSLSDFGFGVWLSGIGLVALAFWLCRYDMAWRSVCEPGLPRFMAVCLLSGYAWLGVGGGLWMGFPESFNAGPYYDAMLHTIFLGFVFSMIFAHAPIIFPSITGIPMPFQQAFYVHFVLLHLSLLVRVLGDLSTWVFLRRWGGLLNVLAILFFLANNVRAVRRGRSRRLNSG